MSAEVKCTAGAFYPEEPRSFTWLGREMKITKIAARSHTAEGRRFVILNEEGEAYELIYRTAEDRWYIVPPEVNPSQPGPVSPAPKNETDPDV